jgi:hypothetical protein
MTNSPVPMPLQRVLSAQGGANVTLQLFGQGRFLLAASCGPQSAARMLLVDGGRVLQTLQVELQLADMAAGAEPLPRLPLGVEADRSAWAPHLLPILDASVSAGGQRLLVCGGRTVRVHELEEGSIQWRRRGMLREHGASLSVCAISADAEWAASADAGGQVLVWGVDSTSVLHRMRVSSSPQTLAWIWKDQLVALGDDRGRVICWEIQQGRRHLQFQAHAGPVRRLWFDAASSLLATAGADGVARLWDLQRGAQSGPDLPHRAAEVLDVTVVAQGRVVLTAADDGCVRAFSAGSGAELACWKDEEPIWRLAADEASQSLLLAGPRTLRVAALDVARLREQAATSSRVQVVPSNQDAYGKLPVQPPSTWTGHPSQAPVGSMLAARATGELPLPDQSHARIERGDPPPRPSPAQAGAATAQPAPWMPPAAGSAPPAPRMPLAAAQSQAPWMAPAAPPRAAASAPPAPWMPPAGAASAAPVPPWERAPAATPATQALSAIPSPGLPGATSRGSANPASAFALDFFDDEPAAPSLAEPAAPASAGAARPAAVPPAKPRPRHQSGALPALGSDHVDPPLHRVDAQPGLSPARAAAEDLESLLAGDRRSPPPSATAAPTRSSPPPSSILAVFLLALLLGVIGWIGTERHYRFTAMPHSLGNGAADIEAHYEQTVRSAQATYDRERARIEAEIESLGADGTLVESEVERMRRVRRRQLETIHQTLQTALRDAETQRGQNLGGLDGARRSAAEELALQGGVATGALSFLFGLVVLLALERRSGSRKPLVRLSRPVSAREDGPPAASS